MQARPKLIVVLVVVALAGFVAVPAFNSWVPSIPDGAPSTLVARTVLEGPIAPDPQEGFDPADLERSPNGGVCLDRIERPVGSLDLCWEAYREPNEMDPEKDYYRLRVYGTMGPEGGTSARWWAVRARLVGEPAANVFEGWPDGLTDGRECESVNVGLFPGLPAETESLCGRIEGSRDPKGYSHTVRWTCLGCFITERASRGVTLQEAVAVAAGTVPVWEIYADYGG